MNDWPPPSGDAIPPASPAVATATPWWRHPIAQAMLVAWVVAGVIVLVALGFVRAVEPDVAGRPSLVPVDTSDTTDATRTTAEAPTAPATSSAVDTTQATAPVTTTPLVASAPPTPPTSTPGVPTTTIVVTLPPTITSVPPPPDVAPPAIDVETRFDADGDDAENLNGEWVRFTNVGDRAVDMTGWIVRDDGLEHAHVFDPLILVPGASVTLFSGCGTPTDSERFFCNDEIWNNGGDVVSLFDATGALVLQQSG